eukprot:GHRQ01005854.1.p1 GENE.GHRQ01005854.1~~GHRQ01005854.1.p1  ORF type:complete len:278 (+),score=143.46 GHRQ01005854.1:87-920(+)
MDYEAEQAMELEALQAIFPDDIEEYEGSAPADWPPHGKVWAVNINPSAEVGADDEDAEPELAMQLVFAHTPSYPDEAPCMRLRSVRGLGDAELAEATAELQQHIADSMGMAMIYNLVTAAQEWLAAHLAAGPAGSALDPEAEERRKRDEEEAARAAARAHGHPVTIESFEAWRRKFEAEQALARAQLGEGGKGGEAAAAGRVTGKAWFLAQMAAGKGSSSEEEEEEDVDDDDVDGEGGADKEQGDDDEDELVDEDEDVDYEDDDDEGLLDEYLVSKE